MKHRNWSRSLVRISPLPFIGGHVSSLIFIFVAFVMLFVSAVNPSTFSGVRSGAVDVAAPLLAAVTAPLQNAASFVRDVSGLAKLQAENARLETENVRLREWYQTALLLEAENKSLQELLNVKIEPQNRYVTARVIGDSGNTFTKSLLLSAGQADGVGKGQAVISGVGLVGRVIEAGQSSSRVLLANDINSRVPVIVDDSRQQAVMAGTNDKYPRLIHMPPDSQIAEGARLITSGHGGIFPQGLPVGRVRSDGMGGYMVEMFADFDRLMNVRIIDQPDDPNLQPASPAALD